MKTTGRNPVLPAKRPLAVLIAALLAHSPSAMATPPAPNTLPTGGQVAAGQASISQSGAQMTVNQASQKAILNWQSFSIGSNAAVNFAQPNTSAVALNRVMGPDASAIFGRLSANGQVFLINPSGVLFGRGAQVDVGGLVASTLNIRNEDFLSGNYRFTRDGSNGRILNQGELTAQYVALLAPEARNEGVISARLGTVAMAGGEAVTLSLSGQKLVDVQVEKASIDTLVENRHLIHAEGGTVILSAQSAHTLAGRVVNSGTVEASGIDSDGGVVRLRASTSIAHSGAIRADGNGTGNGGNVTLIADLDNPSSRTDVSGSLTARGGANAGDGGFIETSASRLKIEDSASIQTSAPNGQVGQWLLDPVDFTIAPNGDISGTALGTALDNGAVTITTTDTNLNCTGTAVCTAAPFNTAGNGDIFVNQQVSWTGANKLTLSAWRNVVINSPIKATAGSLALEYNQATGNPGGAYFVFAPITLPAGANFSTKDGANPTTNFTVITARGTFGGGFDGLEDVAGDLNGNYAIGANIDLGGTEWTPLGDGGGGFTGTLEGLRNKIIGLKTTGVDATYVGLFGAIDAGGTVRNLGVETHADGIKGAELVGVVAGTNAGTIRATYSKGVITGSTNAVTVRAIGGLVGLNEGSISESYSAVNVDAAGGDQGDGGGINGGIGGLVGVNKTLVGTSIYASYATGQVNGAKDVGGLVGYHEGGSIQAVYSTGQVTSTDPTTVGGLIGTAQIENVVDGYWDTTTSTQGTGIGSVGGGGGGGGGGPGCPPICGGGGGGGGGAVVGYATADMKIGTNFTGGGTFDFAQNWVPYGGGSQISDGDTTPLLRTFMTPLFVYADNANRIYDAQVGFAGLGSTFSIPTPQDFPAAATNHLTTTTVTLGGTHTAAKDAGIYTIVPTGPAPANKADQHGFLLSFVNGIGTITPKALTVNTAGVANTKIYDATTSAAGAALQAAQAPGTGTTADGNPYTGDTITLTGNGTYNSKDVATATTIAFGGLGLGGAQAGNYTLTPPAQINGATITPKALTVDTTGVANTKVYDGTNLAVGAALLAAQAPGAGTTVDGKPYTGDTVTLAGNGVYNSSNVLAATTISFGALALGGAEAGNYSLTGPANINGATITPKPLTMTGTTAANKTYDGNTTAALTLGTLTGFVNPQTVTATAVGTFDSKDAGIRQVTAAYTLQDGTNDGLASNYSLANTIHAAIITPKALTVTGTTAADKAHDGTTTATITVGTLSGFIAPETVTATATGTFDSAAAGDRLATAVYTLLNGTNGGLATNYSLANTINLAAKITGGTTNTPRFDSTLPQTSSQDPQSQIKYALAFDNSLGSGVSRQVFFQQIVDTVGQSLGLPGGLVQVSFTPAVTVPGTQGADEQELIRSGPSFYQAVTRGIQQLRLSTSDAVLFDSMRFVSKPADAARAAKLNELIARITALVPARPN